MKNNTKENLKFFILAIGICAVAFSLFSSRWNAGTRITSFIIGAVLCLFTTVDRFRWGLISIFCFGLTFTGLPHLVDETGSLSISGLLMVGTFLVIAIYYLRKLTGPFRLIRISRIDLSQIDSMTGLEFENYTAALLRKLGYTNVSVTKASGDQGIDVLANKDGIKYAIQCKHYSSKLSNTPVQEAFAGKFYYGCDVAVVITNSTFTAGAIDLASSIGVLLWDRQTLQEMISQTGGSSYVPTEPDDIIVTSPEELEDFLKSHVLIDTLETKVAAVDAYNQDGTSRQKILKKCSCETEIALAYSDNCGTPAYAVICRYGQIGTLPENIAKILDSIHGECIAPSTITSITPRGDGHSYECTIRIQVYGERKEPEPSSAEAPLPPNSSPGCFVNKPQKKAPPSLDPQFIAEAQWYAARGGADLIDDE